MLDVNLHVMGLALLLFMSNAGAGIVSATWDAPGNPTQESFLTLYAVGADDGPQTFAPLSFPFVGGFNAGSTLASRIESDMNFTSSGLQIDFRVLDRRARDTSTNANGAWVFSVTEPTKTIATGGLTLLSSGIYTENGLWARLFDYTTQEFLFQSSQNDYGFDKAYLLGGLVGNRGASFSGSLENTLLPGHVYSFDYSLGSGNNGAGDFGSRAIG